MGLLHRDAELDVLLLGKFVPVERLDELVALLHDVVCEVGFFFGLLRFRLRLQGRLQDHLHVGPSFLDQTFEESGESRLNLSHGFIFGKLVH